MAYKGEIRCGRPWRRALQVGIEGAGEVVVKWVSQVKGVSQAGE